jgi:hypothetical protein
VPIAAQATIEVIGDNVQDVVLWGSREREAGGSGKNDEEGAEHGLFNAAWGMVFQMGPTKTLSPGFLNPLAISQTSEPDFDGADGTFGMGAKFHGHGDHLGFDFHVVDAEDRIGLDTEEAVQWHMSVQSVPKLCGGREVIEITESIEHFTHGVFAVLANKDKSCCAAVELINKGSDRIAMSLIHLGNQSFGVLCHGDLEFRAADLASFKLAKEFARSGQIHRNRADESEALLSLIRLRV